ncbi:TPA: hypothetical protein GF039_05505 [Citrobacter rodentium]|nr:hypothetical protein [Citrobacter rodentium]
MTSEIVLNLDFPEYKDDFCTDSIDEQDNELWQQQANKKLLSFLEVMGEEARRYKENNSRSTHPHYKTLSSYHHAIFISGARGAGKTVFMRNARFSWQKHYNKDLKRPKLYFIDVIDPTLLNIDDRFSEVIIASIYATVEKRMKQPDIAQNIKDNFINSLKTLSGALGKSKDYDEYRGIDRIQKYRSGIHLEKYFHQFLISSVELLDCDALVLPIDDVDMKIDNAFGVLDDIRCLLSCPLVLPLVSGDNDLYRFIAKSKFEELLNRKANSNYAKEGSEIAERLSEAYITKVFPSHVKIPLQPIDELLPYLYIHSNEDENKKHTSYSEFIKLVQQKFYFLCNGQERSTNWPQPRSAREVTQLIRSLPPSTLSKEDDSGTDLWQRFAVWAEERRDGLALTNVESYLFIKNAKAVEDLNLSNLIAFNPLLQKGKYPWAEKDFYKQQSQRRKELNAPETNSGILNTVFSEQRKDFILRSMPALELIMEPMYVTKTVAEKNDNSALIAIYTHSDYYSQQQNRRCHIFFGRAFEIMFWSVLAKTENLPQEFYEKDKFKSLFGNIFKKVPFYSIFSMNPTKVVDEENDDGSEPDFSQKLDDSINELVEDIYIWATSNKLRAFKNKNLIPLMTCVFNKVFSQINVLRKNVQDRVKFRDEHLSDLAKRFEYMFINAIFTFIREGVVVNTNVATGAAPARVRNLSEFNRYDKTLSRNMSGILSVKEDNGLTIVKESEGDIADLLFEIWHSPLFKLTTRTCYPIGKINSQNTAQENLSSDFNSFFENGINFELIKQYYWQTSNHDNIRTADVREWATSRLNEAIILFSWMKESKSIKAKIDGQSYEGRLFRGLQQALEGYEEV